MAFIMVVPVLFVLCSVPEYNRSDLMFFYLVQMQNIRLSPNFKRARLGAADRQI
jgi:hypothetical protein